MKFLLSIVLVIARLRIVICRIHYLCRKSQRVNHAYTFVSISSLLIPQSPHHPE